MYSPIKNDSTNIMRLGKNKKKHIIKGTRKLQMDKQYINNKKNLIKTLE